jgi:superfamily II DNA or RNA helicase
MPDADVWIVDEVHRWFEYYGETMCDPAWTNKPVIGLSATPWRRGLGNYFSKLIKASTTQELIDGGLLSDFKVFSPTHPDLEGVKVSGGDYVEGELSERMQNVTLVADAVDTWLEHGKGRPTLCFAVDRAHGKHLEKQFSERGVRAAYQDAFTKDADRRAIKKGFHDGSIEVVVNIGTLTTGVDWDVRCIVLCRPTKSEILFVQIIGRGLRTAPDKDHLLVLDHSDNHLRLGFVTDIDVQHTQLLNGSDKTSTVTDKIRLPKECPACSFLKPPGTAKCPVCSFVAVKHNKIEPTAGELKELERKKKLAKENIDPRVFFAELLAHAQLRGYQPGWAANKYREKFDVWPRGLRDVRPAAAISLETAGWIKSRQIAWARSKRRFA